MSHGGVGRAADTIVFVESSKVLSLPGTFVFIFSLPHFLYTCCQKMEKGHAPQKTMVDLLDGSQIDPGEQWRNWMRLSSMPSGRECILTCDVFIVLEVVSYMLVQTTLVLFCLRYSNSA